MLVFCTTKYFESRACARELLCAALLGKPLIVVIEPDATRGGLSPKDVENILVNERYPPYFQPRAPADQSWVTRWSLGNELHSWGFEVPPTGEQIVKALFLSPPIEWNRSLAFQAATVRLIAEQVLPEESRGNVYVRGEIGTREVPAPILTHGRLHHVFMSLHNIGCGKLMEELEVLLASRSHRGLCSRKSSLKYTDELDELNHCEYMLVYLTALTWTSGVASASFAKDVATARRLGVRLLLVHEMPCAVEHVEVLEEGEGSKQLLETSRGADGASNDEPMELSAKADAADTHTQKMGQLRHACEFNDFYSEGWTPEHLLQGEANVYRQGAVALKPGPWRAAGLVTVMARLASGGGEREPVELSPEVEDAGLEAHAACWREVPWRKTSPAFYFLSAESVLEATYTSLPRMQTLRDQGLLRRMEIPLVDAFRGVGIIKEVLFVSHRWEEPSQPDTTGEQLAAIRRYLLAHPDVKWIWFE